MSADLHVHVMTGVTEDELALFKCNTFGSRFFDMSRYREHDRMYDSLFSKMSDTPNEWVGEVSWLKAGIMGSDEYIPDPVQAVSDIVGEDLPVIDDEFIKKIADAMGLENSTTYVVSTGGKLCEFLSKYKGERVFTISW